MAVRSYTGKQAGLLEVAAYPFNANGKLIEEAEIEEPDELVGKDFQFKIELKRISEVSSQFTKVG